MAETSKIEWTDVISPMPRVSLFKSDNANAFEIWHNAEKIGTMMHVEDREGYYWAWNTFLDGRFDGSSARPIRLTSLLDAVADLRERLGLRVREELAKMGGPADLACPRSDA